MFKTYLTIAYRNFIRNKIFSLINVLGLSIGISASLVIFLIVQYDFNFDKFQPDRDRLYRVVTEMNFFGSPIHNQGVPSPLPDAVKKEVTGIDEMMNFHQYNGEPTVSIRQKPGEKPFVVKNQKDIILADRAYFDIVPYTWVAGSPQSSLESPFRVVLTEERAAIYFPNTTYGSIIGKQIRYDDSLICTVSGIVKYPNQSTDFVFKEFVSLSTIPAKKDLQENYGWEHWGSINGGSQLFVKLSPGVSPKTTEYRIQSLEKKYDKDNTNPNSTRNFRLQPFDDIHFSSVYPTFGDHTASKPVLYGLLAVAAFLLILACINFVNLTTAQSIQRAKEIGVRKTLGSSGKQLIFQFLTETFFLTLISFFISLLLMPLILKIFSDFIPADLHLDLLHQPFIFLFGIGLTIVVSLLAGFYPALVLSRFKPALVLKNQVTGTSNSRRSLLRKSLILSQFLIAQAFVMSTLIAVKQIHFVLNKEMGFRKEAIINVSVPMSFGKDDKADEKRIVLLNQVRNMPGIEMVSLGGETPSSNSWNSRSMKFNDGKKDLEVSVRQKFGDSNYLKVYHIPLLAGRYVKQTDTATEYVINETLLHMLGFQNPKDALNKQVNGLPIVGVMADFNQESLHSNVKALSFSSEMGNSWMLHIAFDRKSQSSAWKTTIASIKKSFTRLYPEEDFSYDFVDQKIAKFYESETQLSSLLKWATGLAIFISCMGLLGLVMYTTNQRTKEIGIRKVLGASIANIVGILSKDFVRIVIFASLVAIPLTWWAMNKWLNNFAYKTTISWWLFLLSIIVMVIIALITLSIQTIRAASRNPVDSLRTE